jgi:nicotinamide-nucleotide amidase
MSTPEVALISIGTELTQGFTLNTNAHWLSNECRQLGFKIAYHLALPDDASYWNKTFKMLKEANVSIVIITGGLGPTADDKTRELIAETFGKPLVYNVNCEEKIKAWFQKRNLTYIETNHIQACFPEGSIILENPVGSAPGFQIDEGDLHLFCLPGVPSEMKKMFQVHLVPWLQSISTTTWYHQDLRLFGLSESALEALLRTFEFENGVYWSSLPMIDCLLFRLYTSKSKEALTKARDQFVNSLGDKADQILISDNGENLIQVIMTLLKEKNQFLGVAESCTGGLLASEWYYLQFAFGFYYAPTAQNDDVSFRTKSTTSFELVSRVVNPDGIPEYGLVFGITLGFGFPEFFPDDTEKRRRAREKERSNAQQKAWLFIKSLKPVKSGLFLYTKKCIIGKLCTCSSVG